MTPDQIATIRKALQTLAWDEHTDDEVTTIAEEALRVLDASPVAPVPRSDNAGRSDDPTSAGPRWRVGRKLGRTLYRDEVFVGSVDTPSIAHKIVETMNAAAQTGAHKPWGDVPHVCIWCGEDEAEALYRRHVCGGCERLLKRSQPADLDLAKVAHRPANALRIPQSFQKDSNEMNDGPLRCEYCKARGIPCPHPWAVGPVADEVERMVHAFDDPGRKQAVRDLAGRVRELEARASRPQAGERDPANPVQTTACPHTDPLVIDGHTAWCADCGALFGMGTWRAPRQRTDPPWLGDLLEALGWQGGTIHDAIREVQRLRHEHTTDTVQIRMLKILAKGQEPLPRSETPLREDEKR